MNIFIMYHVHHLCMEIEGKKPTKVPKSTPNILTNPLLYSKYRMSGTKKKAIQFSAEAKKVTFII